MQYKLCRSYSHHHYAQEVDADVEHRHEEADSLEEVANKQDTEGTVIRWVHRPEHVEGHNANKHHWEDEEHPCWAHRANIMRFVVPDHEERE